MSIGYTYLRGMNLRRRTDDFRVWFSYIQKYFRPRVSGSTHITLINIMIYNVYFTHLNLYVVIMFF